MNRLLACVSSAALFAASASAQCLPAGNAPTSLGIGDDTLFPVTAMGINFPMVGAQAPLFTHCVVSTNGVLYLTTGGGASGAAANAYGSVAQLTGVAGSSPRIAAFWDDLEGLPANAANVGYDTSVAGRFRVKYVNVNEFLTASVKSFMVDLFDTGVVTITYGTGTTVSNGTAEVGVSIGNGVANPGGSNLSASPTSATGIVYEIFDAVTNAIDLAGKSISFVPAGAGYSVGTTCQAAFHETYGTGCYNLARASFYQYFANAALAAAALTGQSMVLTPVANGYTASWGGGTYVAPTGAATVLAVGDDGEVTRVPSIPLPTPFGAVATLYVHGNGFVSAATNNVLTPDNFTPNAAGFLNAPGTAFWSWHDFNAGEIGSGAVKYQEAVVGPNTIAYVTWDSVENYPVVTVNRSTLQFQLNLTTGVVTYVWQSIDANTTSPYGSAHLVGFSPGGTSLDPGGITLATGLPVTTSPDVLAMTLSASPVPVSNGVLGTVVTYTTSNMPEYLPTSGVYIGMNILSLGQIPGGLDLFFLGAPGCNAYVASLDFPQTMVGVSPTQSVTFTVPTLVAVGTELYSQSVALITPNSLPNGQNAFGLTVSNGVRSYINAF